MLTCSRNRARHYTSTTRLHPPSPYIIIKREGIQDCTASGSPLPSWDSASFQKKRSHTKMTTLLQGSIGCDMVVTCRYYVLTRLYETFIPKCHLSCHGEHIVQALDKVVQGCTEHVLFAVTCHEMVDTCTWKLR